MASRPEQVQYVLNKAKEYDVKFIRLWFSDILGFLKSFAITVEELELSLTEGQGFDGSSIQGFARIDESDMVAMPDPSTFVVLPWRPREGGAVARMFCDILQPDGSPYVGDPRYVLKRALKRAADRMLIRCGQKQHLCDADELVNEVWLNSMRRRPADDPEAYNGIWFAINGWSKASIFSYDRKARQNEVGLSSLDKDEGKYRYIPAKQGGVTECVDASDQLKALLRKITSRQRAIVTQRLEGLNQAEIAQRLGVSPGLVSVELRKIKDLFESTLSAG